MLIEFSKITVEQKIDFFLKCQELLIKYHPDSEFVFREDNLEDRFKRIKDLFLNYKGYCYVGENICILLNKIKIENPDEPIQILRDNMYQEAKEDYNAFSVDFAAFRELKDCFDLTKKLFEPRLKYLVFVKNGAAKVYDLSKFISSAGGDL